MNKKFWKILAGITAAVIFLGLAWFANAFLGNPVSKALATRTARQYLSQTYGDTDFVIQDVSYSFKDGGYYAHVSSPTSIDSHFTFSLTMTGKLSYDSYEHDVLTGNNTAYRLDMAYRDLVDTVLESPSFPYTLHIAYGTLQFAGDWEVGNPCNFPDAIPMAELELDRVYDLSELGSTGGHLVLYVEDDTVTVGRMAEILLDVKVRLDRAGIPFYAVDMTLMYPREEDDTRKEGSLSILGFLSEDITPEGLETRVQDACDATQAYWAEQDKERLSSEP